MSALSRGREEKPVSRIMMVKGPILFPSSVRKNERHVNIWRIEGKPMEAL